jgi:acyl CoA:acetate/3-ketoacid CoA transferase
MCAAAKTTIVEVEEIVENGSIDPDHVHVPGIYINRIVLGKDYVKKIEVNCTLSIIITDFNRIF